MRFRTYSRIKNLMGNKSGCANKVNLAKQRKEADKTKTHFEVENLMFFEESNQEIERVDTRSNFQV